jgi:predicted transcriptional regulator
MPSITVKLSQSLSDDLSELSEDYCSCKSSVIRLAIKRLAKEQLSRYQRERIKKVHTPSSY